MTFRIALLAILIYPVLLHSEDSLLAARKLQLEKIKGAWSKTPAKDDSAFAARYSVNGWPVQPSYYRAGTFPKGTEKEFSTASPGKVIGPFVDGNYLTIYRIQSKEKNSDSAQVAHILYMYQTSQAASPELTRTKAQAKKSADSLCALIRSGKVKFDDVVESETDDPGSVGGNKGNYGWFTRNSPFVKPYEDAGFDNPVGATVVVESVFGYHIIQVKAKSSVHTIYKTYSISQRIDTCIDDGGNPVIISDASFPGDSLEMVNFLRTNSVKYDSLQQRRYRGVWIPVSVDVLEDGTLTNFQTPAVGFLTPAVVEDLEKLFLSMPKWNPARFCSGPVPTTVVLGYVFE